MIKASLHGDLYRIYVTALKQNINYYYVDIPDVYKSEAKEVFDVEEMNRLYQLGYETGQQKDPWQKAPPGLQQYIEKQENVM